MKLSNRLRRKWAADFNSYTTNEPYKVLDKNLHAKLAMWCSWISLIAENTVEVINLYLPQHFQLQQQYFQLNDWDEHVLLLVSDVPNQ